MKLELHDTMEENLNKTLEALKEELAVVRAGRANPGMLDKVMVDYYGTQTPLKQMAAITSPDPRSLLVQPWDKNSLGDISKAIQMSNLGFNPTNDGNNLRINIPIPTEERRKELEKLASSIGEQSKVAVRNVRRDVNDKIKAMEKEKELTEDDSKKALEEAQKLTDKFIKNIDELISKKQVEIREV